LSVLWRKPYIPPKKKKKKEEKKSEIGLGSTSQGWYLQELRDEGIEQRQH
jgi:hypothetical protein